MKMNEIEKKSMIDKKKLNEEFYFNSLIETAYSLQMLTDGDLERIQLECLELIAERTERYNSGDSSSVRVEVAQSIMTSNLYTIGINLKSYPNPDDAVNALKGNNIKELYLRGRKRIDMLIKSAKTLHSMVLNTLIETENECYNATVKDDIKGFFKLYYPDFAAHEIHITADYPAYNYTRNYAGIEFIQKYLEAIYYENMACRNFSAEDIHNLLSTYDENYKYLIFNIYEVVLPYSDRLFDIPKYEEKTKLQFSFGDKIDNELYRKVVAEITDCRHLSDKIAIIKEHIRSLADLEDILLDSELSANEITGILRELSFPEIAALVKKYPFESDIEAVALRESELMLTACLHDFVVSLPKEQQEILMKAVEVIDIEE